MKFGREADFEKHVLHDVGAVGTLKPEGLSAEGDIVESPNLGGEHGWIAHLSGLRHESEANSAAGRVTGRPTLAGTGIRCVAIGPQALPIDPSQRERGKDLLPAQTQHLRYHG